ncbi:prenyltransferase/squalene oxidase repeat-containing protein [Anatilimnocola floriformis]|uniref:prenyltransferase/squalene oxidase repeat-containing protein n=1 Tax=Anatilimnocola floriformis TaxID=2948575 RepID=UPI0020C250A2|nr:prenyltransferase/squalene oxidase repeat-containing protein [Anatilimnocola floriformis]
MNQISADRTAAIDRGLAWLLKQQAADGGWHSQAYGQLKGGAAVTSLVLELLSQFPVATAKMHEPVIERAFRFLGTGLEKKKTIAAPDGSLDFPTYGCALILTASAQLAEKIGFKFKSPQLLRDYLFGAQLLEPRGFTPDQASYGGWDFLGAGDAMGITTGTNVSVVAHILEALSLDRSAAADKARAAAKGWVARCQQPDGGFAFTPEPMSLNNKAEFADEARARPRSYGSATVDGVRCLLALGQTAENDDVKQAVAWLSKRPVLDVVPGFEDLPAETDWRRGLRFYYYSGLSAILPQLPQADRPGRQQGIEKILLKEQQADGRWQNESDRMRENDPLIATAFALSALLRNV